MSRKESAEQLNDLYFLHAKELCRLLDAAVPQGENGVLLLLHRSREPMYAGDLVQRLGLTSGRIANILRKLEEKGLVLRETDGGDHRRVLVRLTAQGVAQAAQSDRQIRTVYRNATDYLGDEDSRTLLHLLNRLIEYVNH